MSVPIGLTTQAPPPPLAPRWGMEERRADMKRILYTCKRCGDEYGEGEEDRGLSPCCLAEGDPQGEIDDDACPFCGRLGNGEPCTPYCGAPGEATP